MKEENLVASACEGLVLRLWATVKLLVLAT